MGPLKIVFSQIHRKLPLTKSLHYRIVILQRRCSVLFSIYLVFSLKPVSAGIEALPTPIHRVQTLTKDTTGMFVIAASEEIIQIQEYFNKQTVKQYIS